MTDLVTVLVPARNEEAFIEACLASIQAQDYAHLDVIVVDGNSSDATRAIVAGIAAQDPRVRVVDNPQQIIPAGLNVGLAAARGRWLVRVDAHSTVPPDYVSRAVALLRDGDWGGVGGRKDGVGLSPAGRAIAAALGSPFGVGNSVYHHGAVAQVVDHIPFGCYPTQLLRDLGGWDERLPANEDYELDWRIRQRGKHLLFDPALRIDWVCRQSVPALFRQYMRYGDGKARVARMHPESLALRHLAAPTLLVGLVAGVALCLRRKPLGLVPLVGYAGIIAVAALKSRRAVGPGERRYLPLAFAAMHLGWAVGFWRALVRLATRRRAF